MVEGFILDPFRSVWEKAEDMSWALEQASRELEDNANEDDTEIG